MLQRPQRLSLTSDNDAGLLYARTILFSLSNGDFVLYGVVGERITTLYHVTVVYETFRVGRSLQLP